MDRDQQAAAAVNILDREQRIIADLLSHFRDMVFHATEKVGHAASVGQASYNSFAMDLMTQSLITSTEELLQLTRQLRELWLVGPLKLPGEGHQEAEQSIDDEVGQVVALLNEMRQTSRQNLLREAGGQGTYTMAAPTQDQGQPSGSTTSS